MLEPMNASDFDIHSFALLDHESVGSPTEQARALELFRDSVARPSLRALDCEIEENAKSHDPGAEFYELDLADLFQSTVEGYLLTVQAMWERGLRRLLLARDKKLNEGKAADAIKRAVWSSDARSLQAHFLRLLGFPLHAFDSYQDLDLLQCLGNAIRHGEGPSAERVHDLAPSLWSHWLAPGTTIGSGDLEVQISLDAPKYPRFEDVTLKEIVLEQMIQSVNGFWADLEQIRCNSFRRKHESVVRSLAEWPSERLRRRQVRVWTAS